jgi:hypothetical protein
VSERRVWAEHSEVSGGRAWEVWVRTGEGPKMKVGRIVSREGYPTVAYSEARPCDGGTEATFPNTTGGMQDAHSWLMERLRRSSIAWA